MNNSFEYQFFSLNMGVAWVSLPSRKQKYVTQGLDLNTQPNFTVI
jgi:hypothetical protein